MATACTLLLALQSLGTATAKIVSGQVTLSNQTSWVYLTKFSYSQGSGNFTLDVKADSVSDRVGAGRERGRGERVGRDAGEDESWVGHAWP